MGNPLDPSAFQPHAEPSDNVIRRFQALIDINARLMTILDPRELLKLIMQYARDLLDVEATSVWERDDDRAILVLRAATGDFFDEGNPVMVPFGEGIVGRTVAENRLQLIDDVASVGHHYRKLDEQSGFQTRSVLCVPLRAPSISLGPRQGTVKESVIGAIQALNKRDGSQFSQDDIMLLEAFASQSATALQTARLYSGLQTLFRDTINIVAQLVDTRDPYTHGHSQRVAHTSVAIAEELGLDPETIVQLEVGGILHDVGKIGVPDSILNKKDRLTEEEYTRMKEHPLIGYRSMLISRSIRQQYPIALDAILEHHRRLDGRGYPNDSLTRPISLAGRILAVADVFDALTSDRPYRSGWDPEEAIAYLHERSGSEFDTECVAAFTRARLRGRVLTQAEWLRKYPPEPPPDTHYPPQT